MIIREHRRFLSPDRMRSSAVLFHYHVGLGRWVIALLTYDPTTGVNNLHLTEINVVSAWRAFQSALGIARAFTS